MSVKNFTKSIRFTVQYTENANHQQTVNGKREKSFPLERKRFQLKLKESAYNNQVSVEPAIGDEG